MLRAALGGRDCGNRGGECRVGVGAVQHDAQPRRRHRHRRAADLLTKREQYHSNVLSQSVSLFEQATRARIEQLTQYFMSHGVIDRIDASHTLMSRSARSCRSRPTSWPSATPSISLGAALIVALARGAAAHQARPSRRRRRPLNHQSPRNLNRTENDHETPHELLSGCSRHHQGARARSKLKCRSSGLEQSLIELVKTRASQINGCAFCINMHTQDARKHGETEQRLYLLNAWREAPLYTDRERAALAWTEAVTLISETHAPDDVYAELRKHFSESEAVNLTVLIGTINTWNRLAIAFRAVPPVRAKAATAA